MIARLFRLLARTNRLKARLEHSQRLHLAGQLAVGVVHDFNNLLSAIIGASDAIAGREAIDAATLDDVAAIRASAERGAALVRHLLALGREQVAMPRPLDVNGAITDLAVVVRRLLPSSVRLELALEQPAPQVMVDVTAFDRVLLNLSVNARNAMPDGGTLTLRSRRVRLDRPLSRRGKAISPGDYALIEVLDNGCGISPEALSTIFDPFVTTRREHGGSGLGLFTVRRLVRQSAGLVAVDSEVGVGTRMRVYLPLIGTAAAITPVAVIVPPPPLVAPAFPSRTRGVLLLVDDEETVLRIAARSLRGQGWEVLSAGSAEAALDLLSERSPVDVTVVVTDLVMPGMDGGALVRAVRHRHAAPTLPAILVSGYAAERVRREVAATLGDTAPTDSTTRFLAKPYDMRELAAHLDELLPPGGSTGPRAEAA